MFGIKRKIIPVEISAVAYDEIALAMVDSVGRVALVDCALSPNGGALDMSGIGLVRGEEESKPLHRPISEPKIPQPRPLHKTNKAPGAI